MAKQDLKTYIEGRLVTLYEDKSDISFEEQRARIEEMKNLASCFSIKIRHILKKYESDG